MRQTWTPDDDQWLRTRMASESEGPYSATFWEGTAREYNLGRPEPFQRTGKALGIRWSYLRKTTPSIAANPEPDLSALQPETLTSQPTPSLHIKKLHVHVPPPIAPRPVSKLLTAVLYGDSHFPFQDDAVLRLVGQIVRDTQPDVLINMGDPLDAYHLSRFDKNPRRAHTLQDEIDECRAHLAAFRLLSPASRFYVLEGNHPDRLRRMLWNMPEQVRALNDLRAFTEAMTWPRLLGLDELGIDFIPYGEETRKDILPKFIVKHGNVVRKLSGYTARAELDKYNKSGASGHTHRLGVFFHRDSNGNHIWVECGCTCKLNPEYAQDPDWQNGCVVMTFEPTTGAFQCEPVYIHNGNAVFRGKFYDAREQ